MASKKPSYSATPSATATDAKSKLKAQGNSCLFPSCLTAIQELEKIRRENASLKNENARLQQLNESVIIKNEKLNREIQILKEEKEDDSVLIICLKNENIRLEVENKDLKLNQETIQPTADAALERTFIENNVRTWRDLAPQMKTKPPPNKHYATPSWTDKYPDNNDYIYKDSMFLTALYKETMDHRSFNQDLHDTFLNLFIEVKGKHPVQNQLKNFIEYTLNDIWDLRVRSGIYKELSKYLHQCVPNNSVSELDQLLRAASNTLSEPLKQTAKRLIENCYKVKKGLENLRT